MNQMDMDPLSVLPQRTDLHRAACRLPPGPPSPRRGREHITRLRDDYLDFTANLKRTYGDAVYYRVGTAHVYQFTHPEHYQQVLVTHASKLRKTDRMRYAFGPWLGRGLLLNEGRSWANQRRLAQAALQPQRLPDYAASIVRHTQHALAVHCGETLDIERLMRRLAFIIAADVLLGSDQQNIADSFMSHVATIERAAYARFTQPAAGRASYRSVDPALQHASQMIRQTIGGIIVEAQRRGGADVPLLKALFAAHGYGDSSLIHDEVMMLLLAASATTATALTWLMYCLARHPHVQQQARDQLQRAAQPSAELTTSRAVSGGQRGAAVWQQSAYLQAVIQETWRLYPPAYTTSRCTLEEVEIGGYCLPAGAQLHLLPLLTHRDERWYDAPLEFRPERFLERNMESRPRFAFLPFGAGPRACAGGGLAMLEAHLVATTLLSQYRIELAPDQEEPELEPLISLHPRAGMRVRLLPYNPPAPPRPDFAGVAGERGWGGEGQKPGNRLP